MRAMEAAWATRSRDLSRGLTQVTSTGADLASRTMIQTIEPNFTSRFDQSRVFRATDLIAWNICQLTRTTSNRPATAAPSE
jgi:hypothetical protein